MMHDDTIREIGRDDGYTAAGYADYVHVLLNDADIPDPADIEIPWFAQHNPALYVAEFQSGYKEYIDSCFYTASQKV